VSATTRSPRLSNSHALRITQNRGSQSIPLTTRHLVGYRRPAIVYDVTGLSSSCQIGRQLQCHVPDPPFRLSAIAIPCESTDNRRDVRETRQRGLSAVPAEAGGAIAGDEIDVACLHWTTKK